MSNTFTSTITESWTGDTGTLDSTKTLTIGSITDVTKRVVNLTTAVVTLAQFAATVGTSANAHDKDLVKYVRITNLGAALVTLGIIGEALCLTYGLNAGESFVLGQTADTFLPENDQDPSHSLSSADIETIEAQASSGTIAVEIVIAATAS